MTDEQIERLARAAGAESAYQTVGEVGEETRASLEFEEIDGKFPGLYLFAALVLEEAAQAIEQAGKKWPHHDGTDYCAAAIRALIPKEKP